jgi:hypothetical protein
LAEFAVEAGVGAGPAIVQALLAVGDLHFLADDAGVPVRVVAAFIHIFHKNIITKIVTLDQPGEKVKPGFSCVRSMHHRCVARTYMVIWCVKRTLRRFICPSKMPVRHDLMIAPPLFSLAFLLDKMKNPLELSLKTRFLLAQVLP